MQSQIITLYLQDLSPFDLEITEPTENKVLKMQKKALFPAFEVKSASVQDYTFQHPEYIRCQKDTFRKDGPCIIFRYSAKDELESLLGTKISGQSAVLTIPDDQKSRFTALLDEILSKKEKEEKEADYQRDLNDAAIKDTDLIDLRFSPNFVTVRYPFDSNQDKIDSKQFSYYIEKPEKKDHLEQILEPYFSKQGCGAQKKYQIPYSCYRSILEVIGEEDHDSSSY